VWSTAKVGNRADRTWVHVKFYTTSRNMALSEHAHGPKRGAVDKISPLI